MKRITVPAILAVLIGIHPALPAPPDAAGDIKAVLEVQKDAWNRGDVEGFMSAYLQSGDLTFQSGNARTRGWSEVLSRYKRNYAAEDMGRLDFTDLSVTLLSPEAAYVLGRFKLVRKDATSAGVFTLILRRTEDGWKIIHDHTST